MLRSNKLKHMCKDRNRNGLLSLAVSLGPAAAAPAAAAAVALQIGVDSCAEKLPRPFPTFFFVTRFLSSALSALPARHANVKYYKSNGKNGEAIEINAFEHSNCAPHFSLFPRS